MSFKLKLEETTSEGVFATTFPLPDEFQYIWVIKDGEEVVEIKLLPATDPEERQYRVKRKTEEKFRVDNITME